MNGSGECRSEVVNALMVAANSEVWYRECSIIVTMNAGVQ